MFFFIFIKRALFSRKRTKFVVTNSQLYRQVACDILTIEDDLQMNLCIFRGKENIWLKSAHRYGSVDKIDFIFKPVGEHIKVINRPNSSHGWEGVFKTCDGELKYEPGLRFNFGQL